MGGMGAMIGARIIIFLQISIANPPRTQTRGLVLSGYCSGFKRPAGRPAGITCLPASEMLRSLGG